jgi:hypothetical protein
MPGVLQADQFNYSVNSLGTVLAASRRYSIGSMRIGIPRVMVLAAAMTCSVLGAACSGLPRSSGSAAIATSSTITPAAAAAAQRLYVHQAAASGTARVDSKDRLQIYVYIDRLPPDGMRTLADAGLCQGAASLPLHLVQGWVLPQDMDRIAALPFVTRVALPRYATPR